MFIFPFSIIYVQTSGVNARESSPTDTSRSQDSDNSQMGSSQTLKGIFSLYSPFAFLVFFIIHLYLLR